MKQKQADQASDEVTGLDTGLVQRCTGQAESAIATLWDVSRKTFWRSTEHRDRDKTSKKALFFPTVSLRCANALLSLAVQAPDWASGPIRRQLLEHVLPNLVSLTSHQLRSTLDIKGQRNVFTLSLYVDTLSQISRLQSITGAMALAAADRLQSVASNLIGHTALRRKGKRDYIPAHPFILYHVSHALLSCQPHLTDVAQRDRASQLIADIAGDVRNAVERLLAKHHLGALAPSESVALAFCGGALLCLGLLEDLPYVLASLAVCLECQDASGCWPLGRVVRENKDITSDKLEIPSFEIAAVIADSVHDLLEFPTTDVEPALLRTFYNRLVRSALYAERSIVHLSAVEEPRVGMAAGPNVW